VLKNPEARAEKPITPKDKRMKNQGNKRQKNTKEKSPLSYTRKSPFHSRFF
jgi:hypothetical protein